MNALHRASSAMTHRANQPQKMSETVSISRRTSLLRGTEEQNQGVGIMKGTCPCSPYYLSIGACDMCGCGGRCRETVAHAHRGGTHRH